MGEKKQKNKSFYYWNIRLFGIILGKKIVNVLFKVIEIVSTNDKDILEIIDNSSTTVAINATKIDSATLIIVSVVDTITTKTLRIMVIAQKYINENTYNDYAMTMRKFLGYFLLFEVAAIIGFLSFKYLLNVLTYSFVILSIE